MQLCSCGHVFAYPKYVNGERLELFGTPCYERFGICPQCEGEDFEDARRCAECGRYAPVRLMEQELCVCCRNKLTKQLQNFLDEFSEKENGCSYSKPSPLGEGIAR